MWFKHKKIQGFYDVLQVSSYLIKNNHGGGYQKANVDNNLILQNRSFAEGADACISLRFRTCARSSWFITMTSVEIVTLIIVVHHHLFSLVIDCWIKISPAAWASWRPTCC